VGLDVKDAGLECIQRARDLAPAIEAAAAQIERGRELPEQVVALLHEAQLFRMLLPRAYDGFELDLMSYAQAIEELAKGDASVAWCVGQASGCSTVAAFLKPPVARDIFGDPRSVLAWGPPGEGGATAVDGGYRVTGRWQFASGARHATWMGAHVAIRGVDGAPPMRTMLVPKSAVTLTDVWQVMGLKGTGSDNYSLADHFVPSDYTAPREHGVPYEAGPLYVFHHMIHFATSFSAISLGLARASIDAFVTLACEKQSKTLEGVLRDHPVIQYQLGLAETRLRCARAFLFESLRNAWESAVTTGELPPLDRRLALRMATTYAIGQGREIVETVYNAAGATAIFESNPFERRFRDVHAVTQQVQGHFSHIENAGKYLLGLDFSKRYI
jgi:alkylation response protein AidB-like acyl-CoA dehydrogenase